MEIKDSGDRREFAGGGVRDMAEGKGACHLLPLDIVAGVYEYVDKTGKDNIIFNPAKVLNNINEFIRRGCTKGIYDNIAAFAYWHYQTLETAMLEVAIHYEMGAKKYEPRNWERIMETDTFVDSATRHFFKFMRGDDDEPHDRAFLWNLLGLLWTVKQLAKKDIANDLQTGLFDTIRQNAAMVTGQSKSRLEK
jgi:hypothetical protein